MRILEDSDFPDSSYNPIMTYSSSFTHDLLEAFWLSLPLIIGGTLHMIVVKKDILSYFRRPIHQRWFGKNKTWRGVVVMPLSTWLGVFLTNLVSHQFENHSLPLLGLGLGMAYLIAELPNSFMKRRLGIQEGKLPDSNRWLFGFFDQADSAIGCMIAYRFILGTSWTVLFLTLILGTLIHLVMNMLLYALKIRENPF